MSWGQIVGFIAGWVMFAFIVALALGRMIARVDAQHGRASLDVEPHEARPGDGDAVRARCVDDARMVVSQPLFHSERNHTGAA